MGLIIKTLGIAGLAAALSISACSTTTAPVLSVASQQGLANNSFPYHPFVYHLDLSILAYQLYGQSLVWPYDPYYEEHGGRGGNRDDVMKKVHRWSVKKGAAQVKNAIGLNAYRGPGTLLGMPNNLNHDPVIYDYSRIYPWSNTLTNADGTWTEYLTPKKITSRIKSVHVCSKKAGSARNTVSIENVSGGPNGAASGAKDMLLAFEGGTGDKGEAGRPASQSLMGFVLVREKSTGGYDIHIAFRGSRSGSAGRAVLEAFDDSNAKGNPDWITDLGYNRLSAGQGTAHISTIGKIHRGFARSMKSIHPNIFKCIDQVGRVKNGAAPDNIYVTGHSLGGALAQAFVASVLIGNQYGPNGQGAGIPLSVKTWPWKQIKLVSYSAPRIGDAKFAETLTVSRLQSEFFSTPLNPVDLSALKPNDVSALARLLSKARPAGFRVLHSKDPITSEKGAGGKHVGKTVYVNAPSLQDVVSVPDFGAHEQRKIRDLMLTNLSDPKIPKLGMRYRQMSDINPARNAGAKGSRIELLKLATALKKYYSKNGIWFNQAAFDRDLAIRLKFEQ